MDSGAVIEVLEGRIREGQRLKSKRYNCPELASWMGKRKSFIRRANEPDFFRHFERLSFRSSASVVGESDSRRFVRNLPVYEAGLTKAQGILRGLTEVLQMTGPEAAPKKKPSIGFRKDHDP